jgi:hypothetical protein
MTFDEHVGHTFAELTDRLRDEIARQVDAERAAGQRLVEAVRAMDGARSLSQILDALVSSAGREAARAAILMVQGEELRGWRFVGFDPTPEDTMTFPLSEAGIVGEAVRTAAPVSGGIRDDIAAPGFAGLPPGREMLAVPIPMSGQVIAVLYADQGVGMPQEGGVSAAWAGPIEIMARHAARCLEVVTAFRAAQALTGRPEAPRAEDEQAARRYARLLTSEIKLYHEADVIAGRRERDLGSRLGGEIARARMLYEERIPPAVRQAGDYFQAEVVRTLADGDASLLDFGREK